METHFHPFTHGPNRPQLALSDGRDDGAGVRGVSTTSSSGITLTNDPEQAASCVPRRHCVPRALASQLPPTAREQTEDARSPCLEGFGCLEQ